MAQGEEEMPIQNGEDYSSSSDDDVQEEEQPKQPKQPPPAPKKNKNPKAIKDTPKTIHYPTVKKKKKPKPKAEPEPMEVEEKDSETEPGECEPVEEEEEAPPPKKQRKKRKQEAVVVPTSNPNITVQLKRRKPGPPVQNIIVYEEDLPPPKYKLIQKTRKKGRPKVKPDVVYEDVDEGAKIMEDKVIIDRPSNSNKEPSARQLKRLELDQKFIEIEAIAGRKLRQTKSGKVDQRSVKQRTPAQIAAARRLAEYNKELRKQKAAEKNKAAVQDVITELAVAKTIRDKQQDTNKKKQEEEPEAFNLFAN